jgi:hypothetical protein
MEQEFLSKNKKIQPQIQNKMQENAKGSTQKAFYKKNIMPRRALTGF